MYKMLTRNFTAPLALVLLASCGGGGGDSGTSPFQQSAAAGCSSAAAASAAANGGANACAVAANLVLQLSSPTIINDGSAKITATATATTTSGQTLSGIPVSFEVDNGATFTQNSAATGPSGQATANVSIGSDPSNRVVTVQAKSNGLTASASFAVTGAKLAATASQAILAPGETGTVEFRLTNTNDVALPNQAISVSTPSAATVTGTTGVNGDYIYRFTAPTTLGATDITATAGGVTKTQTIVVQTSSSTIPAAVGLIRSASVAANPSVVPTNTIGSTVNRTEIRALFVGDGNAPIRNVRVRFDLNLDPSSIGGTFSTGNAVIYSDANGIATTAYIPGDRASPTNGVTIRACYSTTDFPVGTCPNTTTATITVVSDPLAVTIGSNAEILVGPNNLTYQRRFVVLVVDASGRAKGNVDIVPSIDLPTYYKGSYVRGSKWFQGYEVGNSMPPNLVPFDGFACANEDTNRNGVNETGEDKNMNGSLEPRKSDVAISLIGGSKTKDDGTAIVQIEYPQNVASWLKVNILVSATGISGTEGRATWTEILPVPTSALSAESAPPFVTSPYGTAISLDRSSDAPCRSPN